MNEYTTENDVPVHACPPEGGGGIMPCCGRAPFEVRAHRITTDPSLVTCWTGSDPRVIPPAECRACRIQACGVEGNTAEPHTCVTPPGSPARSAD